MADRHWLWIGCFVSNIGDVLVFLVFVIFCKCWVACTLEAMLHIYGGCFSCVSGAGRILVVKS